MGIEEGFGFLQDAFIGQTWLGSDWIIPSAVLLITLVLISRDVSSWKILAFPVAFGLNTAGMLVPYLLLIATGFLFVFSALSPRIIGNMIQPITQGFKQLGSNQRSQKLRSNAGDRYSERTSALVGQTRERKKTRKLWEKKVATDQGKLWARELDRHPWLYPEVYGRGRL